MLLVAVVVSVVLVSEVKHDVRRCVCLFKDVIVTKRGEIRINGENDVEKKKL